MKKLIIAMVIIVPWSTSALAFDPMGPPTAGLRKGQFSAGAEYVFSEIDVEADGLTIDGLTFGDTTIKNITSNKVYANIGYGLTNEWDVFLRLGVADADIDKSGNRSNLGSLLGNSDFGFAVGGGAKFTFFESEKIKWGVLTQISWGELDFDRKSFSIMGVDGTISADIDIIEIQIAIGPTYQLMENVSIYGGPFLHFLDGDADLSGTLNGTPGKGSTDIEQDSMVGGYVGTEINLTESVDFNIEFQGTGAGYALGMGLIYRF